MAKDTVTIRDNSTGKELELPLRRGTIGPAAVDITTLYREFGYLTYDPGFMSTASCRSSITYVDGNEGVLLFRGYPIEQLAEHSTYMEAVYLLLYGELPTVEQLADFKKSISLHTMINESLKGFYNGFHHDAHPMASLMGVVGSLSSFYPDAADIYDPEQRKIAAHRIVAKIPTIAAASYKYSIGEPFVYPQNSLDYCANLLHMMFALPSEEYHVDPVAAKALDLIFMLHLDHEQNVSTSTVRLSGSTGTNPFACMATGISALWGPAHGGANEAVLTMLEEIGDVKNIARYIEKAKDKTDPFRLMGFGHRVYKNYDPRAKLIRKMCYEVLDKLGDPNDPMFELALKLEEVALNDDYFVSRKLYPNVDFYSGIIYRVLGIPTNMFTVMFAIARAPGWVAQWLEMITEPDQRIGRPRQVYEGSERRDFTPIAQR